MKLSQLLLGECAFTRAAKWTARHYYVKYSLLFVIVALIAFAPVVAEGKSLVNGAGDGLRQHYIALLYFGRWGRAVLSNLWAGHGLVVPMWDFTIGYGADVLTTFNYYVIGDPLNLLSIACPSRYTECLYSGLIVLRMYLAGLAFSAYCISKKKQKAAVLAGAIAYAFSGWAFQAGWSHPFFLNPLIYFPLLLMGFDRVFDNRSPVLFIIAVAISLASNFYFFYMLVIALACYALVKFLSSGTGGLMAFMRLFGKSVGFGAIGVLIASVVFVPVLLLFLGTDGLTADVTFSLIYDPAYYATFPATLITAALESNWTAVGISAPLLLGVIAAALGGGRYRVMQVCLLVSTAALLIPAAGWALNGFSYVSNRWTWAYVMLLCYVSARRKVFGGWGR